MSKPRARQVISGHQSTHQAPVWIAELLRELDSTAGSFRYRKRSIRWREAHRAEPECGDASRHRPQRERAWTRCLSERFDECGVNLVYYAQFRG
jgi:hypothetical protein